MSDYEDWLRSRINYQKRAARMKAARALGTHTREQWERLRHFCNYTCVRCGLEGYHLDRDHILPVCLGGSDSIENIQPLCSWCNASKGPESVDFRPVGWREVVFLDGRQ